MAAAALRPVAGYHGAIKKLVVPTYISSSVLTIDPTGRLHCTEIVHHVVLYEQELVAPEVGWGRPRPVTIVIRSASPRRTVVDDDTGQAASMSAYIPTAMIDNTVDPSVEHQRIVIELVEVAMINPYRPTCSLNFDASLVLRLGCARPVPESKTGQTKALTGRHLNQQDRLSATDAGIFALPRGPLPSKTLLLPFTSLPHASSLSHACPLPHASPLPHPRQWVIPSRRNVIQNYSFIVAPTL